MPSNVSSTAQCIVTTKMFHANVHHSMRYSCGDHHIHQRHCTCAAPEHDTTAALIKQPYTHFDHSVEEASISGKPSSMHRSCSPSPSALEGPLKSSSVPGLRSNIFGSGGSTRSAIAAAFAPPVCAIAFARGECSIQVAVETAPHRPPLRVSTVPATPL